LQIKSIALWASFYALPGLLSAQFDFKLDGRDVQVHSFGSQGFLYSNNNNYLTTDTTRGSWAFTDFGANISTQLTEKFRVGAQIYDRNVGHIGNWKPDLDWAFGDYKFKPWFGVRGGKVKTSLGLYNDTQDMSFIQTWALLPQSIYPVDLRGNTIAHAGGDVYGNIPVRHMGSFDYTVYGGQRPSDLEGGITRGLAGAGITLNSYGGTTEGIDLRWNTPVKGLMAGASAMGLAIEELGTRVSNLQPYSVTTVGDHTEAYYTEYVMGNFRFDGEYRRETQNVLKTGQKNNSIPHTAVDLRGGFVSAAYRVSKWVEFGAYYSRFYPNWAAYHGPSTNHQFDQAITARVDLRSYLDLKIEGHFIDGAVGANAYHGFYTLDNPTGLQPKMNLFVVRLEYHM
jgi:hypothetical protein